MTFVAGTTAPFTTQPICEPGTAVPIDLTAWTGRMVYRLDGPDEAIQTLPAAQVTGDMSGRVTATPVPDQITVPGMYSARIVVDDPTLAVRYSSAQFRFRVVAELE